MSLESFRHQVRSLGKRRAQARLRCAQKRARDSGWNEVATKFVSKFYFVAGQIFVCPIKELLTGYSAVL